MIQDKLMGKRPQQVASYTNTPCTFHAIFLPYKQLLK